MKYLRPGLAAAAAIAVVSALSLQSQAVAAPQMSDPDDVASVTQSDNLPNPLADKRRAEKLRALAAVTSGEAKVEQRGRSIGAVIDGKFVEQAVSGEDEIFVVTTEFGDEIHPDYGGDPGPLHNQIEEPDRDVDNTTIWQEDYDRDHYVKIYSETADNSYASLANFVEEMSSGIKLGRPLGKVPVSSECLCPQICVVGLEIRRTSVLDGLFFFGKELDLERGDDRLRDLVLQREDVGKIAIVAFRPDVLVVRAVDQLRGDPHAIARFAHAAFEHVRDLELPRDLRQVDVLAFERERGVARDHRQRGHLAQVGDDVFADAVGEILLLGVAAHVRERQDGDGNTG